MKKVRSIHFVGVKGVGVAPLAIIAKEAGILVTGSDIADEFITDFSLRKAGITPFVGFSKEHVGKVELLITTGAHGGFDNEEVVEAKKRSIPVFTQGEAVGKMMAGEILGRKNIQGISVAGSHGKTTTTAMIATILSASQKDPSYVIGTGWVPSLGFPGHYGKGTYYIAEADEYATEPVYDKTPKLLWQKPFMGVITNIELDHPDLYDSIESITQAFSQFAKGISPNGVLVAYGDDPQVRKLMSSYSGRVITYGFGKQNDFQITRVSNSQDHQFFSLSNNGIELEQFMLFLSGEHNVLNATASIIVAIEAGLPLGIIKKSLTQFHGSQRRYEYIGKLSSGAIFYDDYAHHPTEIKRTLKAFKQQFPRSRLVCVFQPHTYSRTKTLFQEFVHAFSDCDTLILTDIYPSLRETPDVSVSSKILAEAIRQIHKDVVFLPSLPNVIEYINEKNYRDTDVVITMGAGDIYKIRDSLTFTKK